MILYIIFGIIGAFFGAAAMDDGGGLAGLVVGFLSAAVADLKRRVEDLERRIRDMTAVRAAEAEVSRREERRRANVQGETVPPESGPVPSPSSQPATPPPVPEQPPQEPAASASGPPPASASSQRIREKTPPPASASPSRQSAAPSSRPAPESSRPLAHAAASPPHKPPPPSSVPDGDTDIHRITDAIKGFFTGGNLVVRVGIIILFFGVAFLLKYAAEQGFFPIEFRLILVSLAAVGLLALGWWLRNRRQGYALALQGGAVGILYINLFAAARLYDLIPLTFAFALMFALVVLSGILAVLQDSLALAAFGAAGGFLAPVLTSTGSGSHVMLFSYYAILNAGIVQIAWYRAWRVLNLLGFVFTFVIGSAWGFEYYRPAYFASTEPFLILFFLFFVAISVLFAFRQPPRLKGYVDGTLVFGLPIVVFALQSLLVDRMEYGLAFSALAMSAFYIILAAALWRKAVTGMRMLTEAFLALGVVFGSLAIPLALDGRWTAAAWSLEGAALVWVGIRQYRVLARNFGLLLQFGAGMAFLLVAGRPTGELPVLNGLYLGSLAVCFAGLFSAYYLEQHPARLRKWERGFFLFMLLWGLLWWFGAGLNEIDDHVGIPDRDPTLLLFLALSAAAMGGLARRLGWQSMCHPPAGLLPVLWLAAFTAFSGHYHDHPFYRWAVLAWIIAVGVHYWLLRIFETVWQETLVRLWHLGGLLLMVFLLTWESAWRIHQAVGGTGTWTAIAWGVLPALVILLLLRHGGTIEWPVRRFPGDYLELAPALIAAYLWAWDIRTAFQPGDPDPLPYVPVLNPLDVTQAFVLMVLFWWRRQIGKGEAPVFDPQARKTFAWAIAAAGFLWLNTVVARAVHFHEGVSYTAWGLYHSDLFQTAISILWTLTALGSMAGASRRGSRNVWRAGATLLAVVVLKLFLVDLEGTGTVARIVSFIAVGGLMLVIGYVSPIPPRATRETG